MTDKDKPKYKKTLMIPKNVYDQIIKEDKLKEIESFWGANIILEKKLS